MSEGALSPGDILPDVSLFSLDGDVVKLRKTGIQVLMQKLKMQVKSFPRQLFQNCKGDPGELLLLTTFAELPPHLEYVGIQLQLGGSHIHFCLYKV